MTTPINYNPNTPTKQLSWADWPIQFSQNFTQLYNAFKENHVALDDSSTTQRGNHTFVQFPEQQNDPQTGNKEFSIFAKDVEEQTTQLHYVYPGNSPVMQFTNYQIYSLPVTSQQTSYFTFLPGKLLVYFGEFGPFSHASGNSELKLNPPIAKNIISANFCIKGTSPSYTPSFAPYTPTIDDFINPPNREGFIKHLFIINDVKNSSMYYSVVANI